MYQVFGDNKSTERTARAVACSLEPFKMNRKRELISDSMFLRYLRDVSGSSASTFFWASVSMNWSVLKRLREYLSLSLHLKFPPSFAAKDEPNPAVTQEALRMKHFNWPTTAFVVRDLPAKIFRPRGNYLGVCWELFALPRTQIRSLQQSCLPEKFHYPNLRCEALDL